MAPKAEVRLEYDLHYGPAEDTITFSPTGKDDEIDLSNTHADKLPEALGSYTDADRKTTRGGGARGTWSRASDSALDTAMIRAWAKENGHEVADRGHIHQTVKDACCPAQ